MAKRKKSEFEEIMESHLIRFKEETQFLPGLNPQKKWQYYDIDDNLYPPIKHSFLQYAYDNSIPYHDYVDHVRSSQAFGFNLLYPLLQYEKDVILNKLTDISGERMVKLIDFKFEYSPDTNLLGERRGDMSVGKYETSVDLLIIAEDSQYEKYAFLVEVKFTEVSFNPCGGFLSKGNTKESKEICANREMLFQDYAKCYLEGKLRRKYFNYFDNNLRLNFPGLKEKKVCPFQSNQCLRNHAFARALKSEKKLKASFFGLVYHNGNQEIVKAWDSYRDLLTSDLKKELFILKASELVSKSKSDNYKRYFKERYKIE
jgi:hypothetical protein